MSAESRRKLALSKFPPETDAFIGVTLTCSYYVGPGASQDYCAGRARVEFTRQINELATYFQNPEIALGKIESVYEDDPAKYGARIGRIFFRQAIEITESEVK